MNDYPEASRQPSRGSGAQFKPDFSAPNTFVKLIVKEDGLQQTFTVHKEHACFHSPVLRAAFTGNFLEGYIQQYRFDDETTFHPVKLLVQWIYKESLELTQTDNADDTVRPIKWQEEDMALAQLWILADKLCMPKLQNKVIDYMRDIASPLRKVLVLFHAAYFNMIPDRNKSEDFPQQMLFDLVALISRERYDVQGLVNTDALDDIGKLCNVRVGSN
ncbi:uncharacterized protein PAC_01015 [Phialocephala subalpina]|uniref:BTB domain-containing protein n=1 Tax=Phialocephala subalpina TaxID=576137 RepID=A0A1L7WEC6_9HELO|nr:uncharacterized protein PAC_01015 [Phialocephala subalpina]